MCSSLQRVVGWAPPEDMRRKKGGPLVDQQAVEEALSALVMSGGVAEAGPAEGRARAGEDARGVIGEGGRKQVAVVVAGGARVPGLSGAVRGEGRWLVVRIQPHS